MQATDCEAQHLDDDLVLERSTETSGKNLTTPLWRQSLVLLFSPFADERGSAFSIVICLSTIVATGTMLGLILQGNEALPDPAYRRLSNCIGYTYFLCWSIGWYPQVLTNYRRGSTVGLSADLCFLNVPGFLAYYIYNITMYLSPDIHRLYRERNGPDAVITTQVHDVAYSLHALLLSSVALFQMGYFDGFRSQRPSKLVQSVIVCMVFVAVAGPILIVFAPGYVNFNWLDYLYILSSMKVTVTLVKYIPQVLLNHTRKSTTGWSIWQILLDLTGGILSDIQLVLDCTNLRDWSGFTGNAIKFFLGLVSIIFDVIFLTQHYILYPDNRNAENGYPSTTTKQQQLESLM